MSLPDPYTQFQQDVVGRLLAHDPLAVVNVVSEDTGVLAKDAYQVAATFRRKTVKQGAGIIVFQAEERVEKENVEGPTVFATIRLRILEKPELNRKAATGTLLTAQAICSECEELFHQWIRRGQEVMFVNSTRYNDDEGTVGKDVFLKSFIWHPRRDRCPPPFISEDNSAVDLACDLPGAAIYYTTDGSFPGPGNDAAVLYSEPFAVSVGTTVSAAAFKTRFMGSDISFRSWPLGPDLTGPGGEVLTGPGGEILSA